MTQPMKYVCERCGSDNVSSEAYVNWNTRTQSWVFDVHIDEGTDWCNDCEEETTLDYVPITDLRTLAEYTIAKEKTNDDARPNSRA